MDLDRDQTEAVNSVDGNIVVIAGPGAGKTRALTERYIKMRESGIPDSDVACFSFSSAAAAEMTRRTSFFDSSDIFKTFHAYCLRLLKEERSRLPFSTIETILPWEGQQVKLLKRLMQAYPAVSSYNSLSEYVNEQKSKNIGVEQAIKEDVNRGLKYYYALAYRDYERIMREEGWLDFDALIKETVNLLENNNEVRARWQRKYINVDECQDTDSTQFRLLQLLYKGNIFTVGDENQLIYEWRSAQAGNLTNIGRVFPGTKTLYMGRNYRSTGKIVEFLKKILPVDNGLGSHMVSMRDDGVDVRFVKFMTEDEEASSILSDIANRGIVAGSAILARTNRQLQLIQKRAMSRNTKAKIVGSKNVWEEPEVKQLIKLTKERSHDTRSANAVMQEIIKNHGLVNCYANTKTNWTDKDPVENLNDVVRLAGRKNKTTGLPFTVPEFLDWFRKLTYARKSEKEPTLTLSTVHQAKGLEFKYVFLVGVNQGTLPHKDGELAEESRIFFVGASRAADELQISYNGNRSQFLNQFVDKIQTHGEQNV
jgi:superfamily I DNA/RNA helicase